MSHITRNRQQQTNLSIKLSFMKGKWERANNFDRNDADISIHDEYENQSNVPITDFPTKDLTLHLLNLQESCMLPCTTVQRFCDLMQNIVCVGSNNAKSSVYLECQANNVSSDSTKKLVAAAGKSGLDQAFVELDSVAKRKRFFSGNLNFVEPKTICYVVNDVVNTESFQYVPVIETLKVLLKNNGLRSQLKHSDDGQMPGILSNFCDGSLFREHAVFQKQPNALQIILYSDEFEVSNPLGPHAGVHKVFAFHHTINNCSASLKSQKDAIQLLALCNANDVKKHGFKSPAEVLFGEMQILEDRGLETEGVFQRFFASLLFIAEDNLNSHTLGGLNCSFGPKVLRPCRYCLISNKELQKNSGV